MSPTKPQGGSPLKRRAFLSTSIAGVLLAAVRVDTSSEMQPPQKNATPPDANSLEAGDFLWPKKPGQRVAYNSSPEDAGDAERELWNREKEQYLELLGRQTNVTDIDKERYRALTGMDYQDFLRAYLDDEDPKSPTPFGLITRFSVGHVAIVDVRGGERVVIEALMKGYSGRPGGGCDGICEIGYADWLKARDGALIWHGRLKGVDAVKRAGIANAARQQIGKPYRFFNFVLDETSGFYCSKLAWYATKSATMIALDDKPEAKRLLWYSPKQMLKSKHLELIANPGDYSRV